MSINFQPLETCFYGQLTTCTPSSRCKLRRVVWQLGEVFQRGKNSRLISTPSLAFNLPSPLPLRVGQSCPRLGETLSLWTLTAQNRMLRLSFPVLCILTKYWACSRPEFGQAKP